MNRVTATPNLKPFTGRTFEDGRLNDGVTMRDK